MSSVDPGPEEPGAPDSARPALPPLSDLAPYTPAAPPERRPEPAPPGRPPEGEGPRELWRRANAATRGTVIGAGVLVLVVAAFLLGRATAPATSGDAEPARADDGTSTQQQRSPEELARARTEDETAKRVARDLVAFVESCAAVAADGDFSDCRTTTQLNVGSTLPLVDGREPGRGEAAVAGSRDGYRIVSVSTSGNTFTIASAGTSEPVRTCTEAGAQDAGCRGGVW